MTEAEIREKIDALQQRRFLIYMTERWTNEDRQMLREVEQEIQEWMAELTENLDWRVSEV